MLEIFFLLSISNAALIVHIFFMKGKVLAIYKILLTDIKQYCFVLNFKLSTDFLDLPK
jgi:hypothetical protein